MRIKIPNAAPYAVWIVMQSAQVSLLSTDGGYPIGNPD